MSASDFDLFCPIADLLATKLLIDCQLTDLDDELARYKNGSAEYKRVFGVMQVGVWPRAAPIFVVARM
jgi:hypothetical protein